MNFFWGGMPKNIEALPPLLSHRWGVGLERWGLPSSQSGWGRCRHGLGRVGVGISGLGAAVHCITAFPGLGRRAATRVRRFFKGSEQDVELLRPGMHQKGRDLRGSPGSGWTGGWRRLPKRLGAVTVGYKCR